MTLRTVFVQELKDLNVELLKMGALVNEAIDNAITVLKNNDKVLAKQVISGDNKIDDMEKSIQGRCMALILRQQPVAADLRSVSSAVKMITDLERIGDHASDISEIVLSMGDQPYTLPGSLLRLAQAAKNMLNNAVAAFAEADTEKAKEVEAQDDIVDDLFEKTKLEIADMIKNNTAHNDMCVNLLMTAKYFERIGDHSKNICEWIEFNATGEYKHKIIL